MTDVVVNAVAELKKFFDALDPSSEQYKNIYKILHLLKENPEYGDKVRRELWPNWYVKKYGIKTLFRVELNKGDRMIYTISGTRDSKNVTILEILNHKDYEKRFRY